MDIFETVLMAAVVVLAGAATMIVLCLYAAEGVRKVWRRR